MLRMCEYVLATCAVAVLPACGCSGDDSAQHVLRAPPDAIPKQVRIPGAKVTVGTRLGTLRKSTDVSAFKISRFPTTVADYALCVRSGACTLPSWDTEACSAEHPGIDGRTYDGRATYSDAPVTCVSPEQSKAYCRWVGGDMPTIAEWFLAARGTEPTRFSWGNIDPDCSLYWRRVSDPRDSDQLAAARCEGPEVPSVGQHPEGRSPGGVEDILMTRGELVGASGSEGLPACRQTRGCIVTGFTFGAIDLVVPLVSPVKRDSLAKQLPTTGFRCVWRSST